ncbi:MAG: hypothetical protein WCB02_21700, partial [Bradyrhizobium sp.]
GEGRIVDRGFRAKTASQTFDHQHALLQEAAMAMASAGLQQLCDIPLRCGDRPQPSCMSPDRHEAVTNPLDEVHS